VGLNTVAQTLLKLGAGQNPLNIYLLGGICSYGLSTIFYVLVLGKLNLSVAYPVVIGLTIVVTMISGAIILREKVLISQWLGVGLLLSGIWAITLAKP
jgi:multidrug transporter EmrE-like cation transporter